MILLAALVLWTGEAFGECAWVLWVQYKEFSLKELLPGWELQGAYLAREECMRVKEKIWRVHADRYRDQARKGRIEVKEVPYETVTVYHPISDVTHTTSLFCLPDTINPKQ